MKFFFIWVLLVPLTSFAQKKGGTLNYNLGQVPRTLNPLSSTDAYASNVENYVVESLLSRDVDTNAIIPWLAKSYQVLDDGLTFEFTLREGVTFHDGKPLTSEDVEFSFLAMKDPKTYQTTSKVSFFENIKSVEKKGLHQVVFKASQKYYGNLIALGGILPILPKHIYQKQPGAAKDGGKKLNRILVGSGPYKLAQFDRKKSIILERNPSWWGYGDVRETKGQYLYDKIQMRFVTDDSVSFEMFKKGDIDYLGVTPEQFIKQTASADFSSKFDKFEVSHKGPKGYNFIAWNLKHPFFKERNVRLAMGHAMDRETMNKKFDHGKNSLTAGPIYRESPYVHPKVSTLNYDAEKALKLLKEAGFNDTNRNGTLDKVVDGKLQEFKFTLLLPNKDASKYFTLYQESLRKIGIDMEIKLIEWNSFVKLLDEQNFDAVTLAWSGGSLEWDPKQVWHSSAIGGGGSNFISYSNPKVDQLIDQSRVIMEESKRIPLLQEVYKLIAEDAPYTFMFNSKFTYYVSQKNIKRPAATRVFGLGTTYWWKE